MSKDWLTQSSEIATLIGVLFVVLAFFGFYRITDLYKVCIQQRNRKIIKNNHCEIISLRASEIKSDYDKDYLKIKNNVYWISNHTTLKYIMKIHPSATDNNAKKTYISLAEFDKLEEKHFLNVEWESI